MTVHLITTGGTIAQQTDHARVTYRSGAELLAQLPPELAGDVTVTDLMGASSTAVAPEEMLGIGRAVQEARADGAIEGVVVTHGTATLEETAYFVHLVSEHGKPIVFTGAQRPPTASDYDGLRNLGDAITVARSRHLSPTGAVVVMAGEIHAAREVAELSSTSLSGFASPRFGPIGTIQDGEVRPGRAAQREATIVGVREPLARVEVIRCYAGMSGAQVASARLSGAEGVVLEGLTSGALPSSVMAAVRQCITAGLVVVVTTRCLGGETVRPKPAEADFVGYGNDLLDLGVAMTDLSGLKARCKLVLLLSSNSDRAAVRAAMDTAEA